MLGMLSVCFNDKARRKLQIHRRNIKVSIFKYEQAA